MKCGEDQRGIVSSNSSATVLRWCAVHTLRDLKVIKPTLRKIRVWPLHKREPCERRYADWWARCWACTRVLSRAKTPNEKETLQRQTAATDGQIDQLVYELYGLTGDEIEIVEGATSACHSLKTN